MKLLSRKEIKNKQSDELIQAQKIVKFVSDESRKLNDFKKDVEDKKKALLADFVVFARRIAGQKASIADNTSEVDQEAQAIASLSTLSIDAESKYRKARLQEDANTQKESELKKREDVFATSRKNVQAIELMLNTKAGQLSAISDSLEEQKKALDREKQQVDLDTREKSLHLKKREKVIADKLESLNLIALSTENTAHLLDEREKKFKEYIADEEKRILAERNINIDDVIQRRYAARELAANRRDGDIERKERSIIDSQTLVAKRLKEVDKDKEFLAQKIEFFEKDKRTRSDELDRRNDAVATREKTTRDAEEKVRAGKLANEIQANELKSRELHLKEDIAVERELLEKQTADLRAREERINLAKADSEERLAKREAALRKREDNLVEITKNSERKAQIVEASYQNLKQEEERFEKEKSDFAKKVADQEKKIFALITELEEKQEDNKLTEIANKKNTELNIEREKQLKEEMKVEQKKLDDGRATLARGFEELRKKQK